MLRLFQCLPRSKPTPVFALPRQELWRRAEVRAFAALSALRRSVVCSPDRRRWSCGAACRRRWSRKPRGKAESPRIRNCWKPRSQTLPCRTTTGSGLVRAEGPSIRISTLSSKDDIRRSLRRLRRSRSLTQLERRELSELPFVNHARPLPHLLLDTTVYIDQLQGRMPESMVIDPQSTQIWHSTVTESELLAAVGLLDPHHPSTRHAIHELAVTIERRPGHRILNPDLTVWRDAGILTGTLARLQHYGKADQRRVLNDALIFLSATKAGLTVLTRNTADYDLLLQLVPEGKAAFYERSMKAQPR